MSTQIEKAVIGLACPGCQGQIEIVEGERIIECPYCGMHSTIIGERGVIRYQVKKEIDRESALRILGEYLSRWNLAINLASQHEIVDLSTVYIPFWTSEAQVAAWVLGQSYEEYSQGSSNINSQYYPSEEQILPHLSWNEVACDVSEFGIDAINLKWKKLELFDLESLQSDGMVFEPLGLVKSHRDRARTMFLEEIVNKSKVYHIESVHVRFLKERVRIIYYPMWIARYKFHNQMFQVVIDGATGIIRYGKAPGNITLGAVLMVLGMALGAFLFITLPTVISGRYGQALYRQVLGFAPFFIIALIIIGITWFRLGGIVETRKKVGRIGETPWWKPIKSVHKKYIESVKGLRSMPHQGQNTGDKKV